MQKLTPNKNENWKYDTMDTLYKSGTHVVDHLETNTIDETMTDKEKQQQ